MRRSFNASPSSFISGGFHLQGIKDAAIRLLQALNNAAYGSLRLALKGENQKDKTAFILFTCRVFCITSY